MEIRIELAEGYTAFDKVKKQEVNHREVVFGRRLTCKDMMDLDNDPQAQNATQYADLIRRKMITKFGLLKMPVPLNVLLSLDFLDREDLSSAADRFLLNSREGRTSEIRENNDVKLMFGFDIDGTTYDVVTFGNKLTGRDEVEADGHGTGVARQCFLLGRQITRLATEDGLATIDGPIALDKFHMLDAEDLNTLRVGAELWKVSFRLKRDDFQKQRNAGESLHLVKGNESD